MRPARAGFVRARRRSVVVIQFVVLTTVIEKAFDAAQTRGIVETRLRRTDARIVTQPPRGQPPRLPARLTAAPSTLGANDGPSETVARARPWHTGRADAGTAGRGILLESDGGSGLLRYGQVQRVMVWGVM